MKAKISIHSGGWKGPFFTIWSGQAVSLLGSSLGVCHPGRLQYRSAKPGWALA